MPLILRLIVLLVVSVMQPALASERAGEITAVMGDAQVVVSGEGGRTAAKGMTLHVGDVLQTGVGGHIHLRMVDDALVSLRPNSKLKVSSYIYRPGVATATQIRLDLVHGTVRSVTGKGGELAKDRFRMNTPVAAIGVRGTDFITQTDTESTRVHVATGAIVLAPLGAGCSDTTLGSCQTAAARVLTAEMRNTMLEFSRGMAEPRLVPLSDKLQVQAAAGGGAKPQIAVQASANTSDQGSIDVGWQKKTLNSLSEKQATVTSTPIASAVPVQYQMVWGRWTWATQGSDLGIPLAEAAKGREVTVGDSMSGLFRDNSGPIMLPQSGRAEFTLRSSYVSLPQTGGAIAGQVQNGTLGVDFNTQKFNTQLNIQHSALASPVTLSASGGLRDDGLLLSTASASNGFVVGSLSRNGAEAGYLFALPTAAGTLNGTTLWIK